MPESRRRGGLRSHAASDALTSAPVGHLSTPAGLPWPAHCLPVQPAKPLAGPSPPPTCTTAAVPIRTRQKAGRILDSAMSAVLMCTRVWGWRDSAVPQGMAAMHSRRYRQLGSTLGRPTFGPRPRKPFTNSFPNITGFHEPCCTPASAAAGQEHCRRMSIASAAAACPAAASCSRQTVGASSGPHAWRPWPAKPAAAGSGSSGSRGATRCQASGKSDVGRLLRDGECVACTAILYCTTCSLAAQQRRQLGKPPDACMQEPPALHASPAALNQPAQGTNLSYLSAANFLRGLGMDNQAELNRVLDIGGCCALPRCTSRLPCPGGRMQDGQSSRREGWHGMVW